MQIVGLILYRRVQIPENKIRITGLVLLFAVHTVFTDYPDEHLAKPCGENAAIIFKRLNEFLFSKVFETILCGIPESFQRASLPYLMGVAPTKIIVVILP